MIVGKNSASKDSDKGISEEGEEEEDKWTSY